MDKRAVLTASAFWRRFGMAIACMIWAVLPGEGGYAVSGDAPAAALEQAAETATPDGDPGAVLETAVQDADAAAEGKGAPPPPDETPEQAAARIEAEHKEKREQEKKEILKEAEQFVESADETIMGFLPRPLGQLLGFRIFNIALWRWLASVVLIIAAFCLIFLIARRFNRAKEVERGNRETKGGWHTVLDVLLLSLRNGITLVLIGVFMRLISSLVVTSYHPDIVYAAQFFMFLGVVVYLFQLVGIVDRVYGERFFRGNRLMETVRPILVKILRFVIIFIAGMQVYQGVTGQPMFSLLAGLGIGGLALALASQETLQNLLGFASIALDKAFLVGDAVSIAGYDGTVEHVGLRSMRLRTYDGNSVVVPNATAINSNIVNLNRRPFIRKEILVRLSPLNPYDKVVAAMDAMLEAASIHDGKLSGLPPVVRFKDFEPARFVIQVLFWYDPEKPFFWDECSRVNLEICKRLSELGILYAER